MSTPEDPNDSQEPGRVRLPELPIFQKYSIALRQEFADAAEFKSILEKTLTRLRTVPVPAIASALATAPAPATVPDAATAPAPNDTEAEADAAFWEMASPDAPRPARKARPKRKPKPPPAIVRVSSSGKPIIESPPPEGKAPANKPPKK